MKLTPALTDKIANAMRAGAYVETAAAIAGVSKQTLYNWLRRAKTEITEQMAIEEIDEILLYQEFLDAVERAQAESEMRDLLNIDKCAMGQEGEYAKYPDGTWVTDPDTGERIDVSGTLKLNQKGNPIPIKLPVPPDWSASAWRLERKYPKKWAKVDKTMEIGDHTETDGSITVSFVDAEKK